MSVMLLPWAHRPLSVINVDVRATMRRVLASLRVLITRDDECGPDCSENRHRRRAMGSEPRQEPPLKSSRRVIINQEITTRFTGRQHFRTSRIFIFLPIMTESGGYYPRVWPCYSSPVSLLDDENLFFSPSRLNPV